VVRLSGQINSGNSFNLNLNLKEMRNFKIFAFVCFSILYTAKSYSQGNVSVHVGPNIPVSAFGSDDFSDADAGGAAVGLNLGLQYIYPLTTNGLGIFGRVDFNYNTLQKDVKDYINDMYQFMGIFNPDVKFYKYINVPISAGLNYSYQADQKVGVFVNAGLALNFLKMTDMVVKVEGITVKTEMDLASNLGLKIGGGLLINRNMSLALDYFALGTHDLKGKIVAINGSQELEAKGKIDFLTLTLGYKF
jgi:opacity protein-like surface antigen